MTIFLLLFLLVDNVLFDLLIPRGAIIDKIKGCTMACPNWDHHIFHGNSSYRDRLGAKIHIFGPYKEPRRTYS